MTPSEPSTAFGLSLVAGLLSAAVSVPVSYVALETYVTLTVSVGHGGLISHLVDAALAAVGLASFFSGFFSTYVVKTVHSSQ